MVILEVFLCDCSSTRFALLVEDLLGQVQFGDLVCNYMLEVESVPQFILDFVLNA